MSASLYDQVKTLRKVLRALLWTIGIVLALVIAFLFLLPILNPRPKTYRFVFPAGITRTLSMTDSGFVMRTMVPGAPPLPREDGFRLVRFDQPRTIDTSEEYVFGHEWFREEVYIVDQTGRRKLDGIGCMASPSLEHYPVQVTCNAR